MIFRSQEGQKVRGMNLVRLTTVRFVHWQEAKLSVFGGKRPLSSSCPYIVENDAGEVVLAGGAAGGSTIISANLQVARNVLDYGMSAGA